MDTLTYWLLDTALVNQDSLSIELSYMMTDSLGKLRQNTDTLLLSPKIPYARRLKQQQKDYAQWKKKQQKAMKKGEAYDSIMPPTPLVPQFGGRDIMTPDTNIPYVHNARYENRHFQDTSLLFTQRFHLVSVAFPHPLPETSQCAGLRA